MKIPLHSAPFGATNRRGGRYNLLRCIKNLVGGSKHNLRDMLLKLDFFSLAYFLGQKKQNVRTNAKCMFVRHDNRIITEMLF